MKSWAFECVAAAAILAAPAGAAWHQASSKHFLIYGDMPESELRDYAERLEKFDAAARVVRSMTDPVVGDGNRVHVYVVANDLDVNRTLGGAEAGVLGYYEDDVRGPFIITPRKVRRDRDNRDFDPEVVFFHEYTHHLQLQSSNRPLPAWLSEGFAEFLGNPIFAADGSISIGTLPKDRVEALVKSRFAPLPALLGGNAMTLGYSGFWGANYVQGWLLNHYLAFEPSRKGQLEAYVKRISAGEDALGAARATFGDLGALERELNSYRNSKQLPSLKIDSTKLSISPVRVTPLSDPAAQIMMQRIYAKTHYRASSKAAVLRNVRAIAARAGNDALVMRTLAEVEYDSGNFEEAGRAADAALKADPGSTEAMLYKGRAFLGQARAANDAALFKEARNWFVKANKADKEDPEPLYLYYRSFRDANLAVPQSALDALQYAAVLAPRDLTLQVRLGLEYLRQNRLAEARAALEPVGYMPHGVAAPKHARRAIDLIAANNPAAAIALLEKEVIYSGDRTDPA